MHTPVRVSIALLGVLTLAACGSQRATESVTERAVVATHAAAEDTPDVMTFTADVSGDVSVQMPPGELVYRKVSETGNDGSEIVPHRVIRLTAENEDRAYALTLTFADDLEAGTHPINSGVFAGTQSVAAELIAYPPGGSAESDEALHYNTTVEGSLTLDAAGDKITGHFEFTAEATRMVDGTETVAAIMAAGTFDDTPLTEDAEATAEAPTEEAAG